MHIENRAIGAGVCECRLRVKGKQVEDLRDLVTVSGEHWIMRMPEGHGSHWFWETGKAIYVWGAASQETCRLLVQEHSRPRELGRAV